MKRLACLILTAWGLTVWGLAACRPAPPPPAAPSSAAIHFTDVTAAAGVDFVHENGASEERYLPETMGAGVAVFDADGDGAPDLLFVNGLPVSELGDPPPGTPGAAFYRNRGDGTFKDETAASGLGEPMLGMGVAVGDLDNDGDLDLLMTGVGEDRLLRNRGDATFEDVTKAMGLGIGDGPSFSSSAAFLDFDRDGWLDLFLGRYVEWSAASDLPCRPDGVHRSYCTPEAYPGVASRLYRNLEGRRFEDVTARAGLERPDGKALGVAVIDLEGDLWPDLVVANDTVRNFLFRNRGDGTFEEVGLESGIALGQSGAPRGAMGIDAGDLDGDGRPDLVIGNFAQEMASVYRLGSPEGSGPVFFDEAARLGVGLPTLMPLAFGVLAEDLDGDGWLDLVFANGHIEPEIARFQPLQRHAQPPAVFRSEKRGQAFVEVTAASGALAAPLVGRGLASGDLDGDGDLDLVVTENGGPARILRNDAPPSPYLRLRLEGRGGGGGNRTGYGALVEAAVLGEGPDGEPRTLRRWLVSGRSYLSASEPVITLGLADTGAATGQAVLQGVRVRWPSGLVQDLGVLEVGRLHVVREP